MAIKLNNYLYSWFLEALKISFYSFTLFIKYDFLLLFFTMCLYRFVYSSCFFQSPRVPIPGLTSFSFWSIFYIKLSNLNINNYLVPFYDLYHLIFPMYKIERSSHWYNGIIIKIWWEYWLNYSILIFLFFFWNLKFYFRSVQSKIIFLKRWIIFFNCIKLCFAIIFLYHLNIISWTSEIQYLNWTFFA